MPAKKMEIQIPTYLKCNYTNQKLKHLKLKNYHKTTTAYKNFSSYNNKKSRSKQQLQQLLLKQQQLKRQHNQQQKIIIKLQQLKKLSNFINFILTIQLTYDNIDP